MTTAAAYHDDQLGDTPTLSRSIAHLLCTASPKHAWTAHPRLNPNFRRDEDPKYDRGTVVHELLLGGEANIVVVDASDWRTKAAQEARYIARVEGKTPLLAHQWADVQEMADVVRGEIADWNTAVIRPPLLEDGQPEVTLTWEDEGVQCRARLDWLHDDYTAVDDIKSTSRSANPEEWSMFSAGYDLQAYMYSRAVEVLYGVQPVFRFVVMETEPPYAVSVVSPGPDVLTLARKKFVYAARLWRQCLESGEWPGYEKRIASVALPPWLENKWLQKEERELVA